MTADYKILLLKFLCPNDLSHSPNAQSFGTWIQCYFFFSLAWSSFFLEKRTVAWLTATPAIHLHKTETFATARIPQAPCWHPKWKRFFCLVSGASLGGLEAVGPNWNFRLFRCFSNQSTRLTPQLDGLKKAQLQVAAEHASSRLAPVPWTGNCSLFILRLDTNHKNNEQGGFCRASASHALFERGLSVSVATSHTFIHIIPMSWKLLHSGNAPPAACWMLPLGHYAIKLRLDVSRHNSK